LRAGDEPLKGLRVVEAMAQIDIRVEIQEPPDGDVVVRKPRQERRDDGKHLFRLCRRRLAADAQLDFAMLPLADPAGTEERDQRAARAEMPFEPGLPGLSGRKAVAVEECAESRLPEARAQRVRCGRVGARIAQEDVVARGAVLHEATIQNWNSRSRFVRWRADNKTLLVAPITRTYLEQPLLLAQPTPSAEVRFLALPARS
jgi:hypothetical protein